jgi:hypothetical protein
MLGKGGSVGTSFALESGMHFRYKDSRGKEVVLEDVTWLAQAVRNGFITPETPLAVGDEDNFRSASTVVAYQQVVVGLGRGALGTAPPVGNVQVRRPARRSGSRNAILGVVAAVVVALLFYLLRTPARPPSAVSATPAPSPQMEASLGPLITELGDSIAVRQHRLEEWIAQQRFDQRLQGRALQSVSSLRALRSAVAAYLGQVDTLQSSVSVVASKLVLRADSLEGTDGVRHGLFAAAGDAMRKWEGDLAAYADVQRATAAILDSLADFTLERQQSFVVRDGQAVFLSRSDAARFRGLISELSVLASQEQRWAGNMVTRYPGWMTALAPADRPAFRGIKIQRSNQ